MKKFDNFASCLNVLESADFTLAQENVIYRTGVIGQFNLTFELAWKALQAVLRLYGVEEFATGSPREVLKTGYKLGFLNEDAVWLAMLKKRNESTHIYDEKAINDVVFAIRDSFISAFAALEDTLRKKIDEAEEDWAS